MHQSILICPIEYEFLSAESRRAKLIGISVSFQAKLPRGIQNIRPHLENVDNVPLLVSLFTDCSAEATCEMLSIMQSYGEIVVCIGSSASAANVDIFLQADCSIAIEPLYPQVRIEKSSSSGPKTCGLISPLK